MKKNIYNIIAILVVMIMVITMIPVSYAAPTVVNGWAWSYMPNASNQAVTPNNSYAGQGLGWISLGASGGGSVTFDPDTGFFSGYGWSPYGGWLDMNPAGPYPTGPNHGARVDKNCWDNGLNNGICPVTGWIRFVVGTGPSSATGGWDGWVKMSGPEWDGVVVNKYQQTMTGNAWGNHVAGWVGFNAVLTLEQGIKGCTNAFAVNFNANATEDDGSCILQPVSTCTSNTGATLMYFGNMPYDCQKATCPAVSGGRFKTGSLVEYYLKDYPPGQLPPDCVEKTKEPNECKGIGQYSGNTYTYTTTPPCQCTTGICTGTPGGPVSPIYKEN